MKTAQADDRSIDAQDFAAADAPPDRGRKQIAHRFNPRTETAAFIIWADCNLHGWERRTAEIAETVGMSPQRVLRILSLKKWLPRVRLSSVDTGAASPMPARYDDALDTLCGGLAWRHAS